MATSKTLLPPPYQTVEDINGSAVAGATVTFLDTGTAVLSTVYADADGAVISANPLTVDAAGRFTVFLSPGQVVDVQYRDPFGALIKTVPGVQAVPSVSGNVDVVGIVGEAVAAGQVVYLSDGAFSRTAGRWYLASASGPGQNTGTLMTLGMTTGAGGTGGTVTIRTAGLLLGLTGLVVGAKYYLGVTAGALSLTQTASSWRYVGQADSTTSLVLEPNPLDPLDAVQEYAGTGTVAQLVVTAHTVLLTNPAPLTIQGVKAGYHGQRVRFVSTNPSGPVLLAPESSGAAAADRLGNFATSAPTPLSGGYGRAEYEYDATWPRWRILSHEQGQWMPQPFSAADFTANGGTWTVASGSVNVNRYILRGTTLTWFLYLSNTTIGGAPGQLIVRLPGGFGTGGVVYAWTGAGRVGQIYDAGGMVEALMGGAPPSSLAIQKNNNAPWVAGVSPVVLMTITLEVG